MKATGSKLIKISNKFNIYQDTDTLKLYLEVFGALVEIKSIEEAKQYYESKSNISNS